MSSGSAHQGGGKHCRICGKDLSQLRRVRDAQGRYRCPTCHDPDPRAAQEIHVPQSDARAGELEETSVGANPGVETGAGVEDTRAAMGFDPAMAETRVDEEALAEPPPAMPSSTRREPEMRLASEEEPGYTGALGPRRHVQLTGGDEEELPPPAPAPVSEVGEPVNLDDIPEDRSDLMMRVRASHLQLPAALCVLGILGAAMLAFSLSASPNQTTRAINAAMNSGISAATQAAGAAGVYALCCGIWLRPKLPWPIAAVRLAAYSSLMACCAIALTRVPTAGLTLMWVVPLLSIVFVLVYLVKLRWIDAIVCGFLIHAAQLGVRMALDADLWTPFHDAHALARSLFHTA